MIVINRRLLEERYRTAAYNWKLNMANCARLDIEYAVPEPIPPPKERGTVCQYCGLEVIPAADIRKHQRNNVCWGLASL